MNQYFEVVVPGWYTVIKFEALQGDDTRAETIKKIADHLAALPGVRIIKVGILQQWTTEKVTD